MKKVIQTLAAMGLATALLQGQSIPGFPKQPSAAGIGEAAPASAPPSPQELEALKKMQGTDAAKVMAAADSFAIQFPKSSSLGAVFTSAGAAAQSMNDAAKTRFYYQKAIDADPTADYARIMLAADIAQNVKDGAQNQNEELARAEKLVNEGMILVDKRQLGPNQSKEEFEAMQRDDMASAHMALGLIYMGRKQNAEAGREFLLSVSMAKSPNNSNLLRAAMAFNNAGQVDQANTVLDRFQKTPEFAQYKTFVDSERDRGKKIREALAAQAPKK